MIELTFAQKENIGFRYVLDALQPSSPFGQALVRDLQPLDPTQRAELQRQFANIQRVLDAEVRCRQPLDSLLRILMTMKMVRATAEKCLETVLDEIELFEIKRFLLRCFELLPHWQKLEPMLQLEGIQILDTTEALDILDPEQNRVAAFFINDSQSPLLQQIRKQKKELELQLAQAHGDTHTELLGMHSRTAGEEEQELARIRAALSLALRPYISAMLHNMDAIGQLDLTVEKARLARRWGGVMPVLTQDRLEMKDMVNPRIRDLLVNRDQSFTPVSIALEKGATVITGANMGGKSVALKTVALNILLVHCGFFPFAKEATVPLFDSIHILSEDLENVDRGLSSFGGEMVRFNQVIRQLDGAFPFIVLDEFARGTNPDEGAAIVQAVTEYLNNQNAITVLATHYDNVAPKANAHYQVVGLRQLDLQQLQREIVGLQGQEGMTHISRYMNYGLYRVEGRQDCPRDALNICRLLGMDPQILQMVEKNYSS